MSGVKDYGYVKADCTWRFDRPVSGQVKDYGYVKADCTRLVEC